MPPWTFGDRIRKARTVTGMNQAEFAAAIKVAEGSLAAWETDRSKPRDIVAVCVRVESISEIPATWLLGLDGDGTSQPVGYQLDLFPLAA